MSDFLDRILAQSRPGAASPLSPRLPGRFEALPRDTGDIEEIHEQVDPAPEPDQPATPPHARATAPELPPIPAPARAETPPADPPDASPPPIERHVETRVRVEREEIRTLREERVTRTEAPARPAGHPHPAREAPLPVQPVLTAPVVPEQAERAAPPVEPGVPPAPHMDGQPRHDPLPPIAAAAPTPIQPIGMESAVAPRAPVAPPAPVIRIHIGRIEIAAAPDPLPPPRIAERRPEAASPSALDRYLRRP